MVCIRYRYVCICVGETNISVWDVQLGPTIVYQIPLCVYLCRRGQHICLGCTIRAYWCVSDTYVCIVVGETNISVWDVQLGPTIVYQIPLCVYLCRRG